eukprot:9022428-Heterocapsa_arctica.AAC.1
MLKRHFFAISQLQVGRHWACRLQLSPSPTWLDHAPLVMDIWARDWHEAREADPRVRWNQE